MTTAALGSRAQVACAVLVLTTTSMTDVAAQTVRFDFDTPERGAFGDGVAPGPMPEDKKKRKKSKVGSVLSFLNKLSGPGPFAGIGLNFTTPLGESERTTLVIGAGYARAVEQSLRLVPGGQPIPTSVSNFSAHLGVDYRVLPFPPFLSLGVAGVGHYFTSEPVSIMKPALRLYAAVEPLANLDIMGGLLDLRFGAGINMFSFAAGDFGPLDVTVEEFEWVPELFVAAGPATPVVVSAAIAAVITTVVVVADVVDQEPRTGSLAVPLPF